MNEREACTLLRKSLEAIGGSPRTIGTCGGTWAFKIPDAPIRRGPGFRGFRGDRPCDLVACVDGRFVGIEVKLLKGYQAFGWRHLRPSQREHLRRIHDAGGLALVAAVVWVPRRVKRLFLWNFEDVGPGWRLLKADLEASAGLDIDGGLWALDGIRDLLAARAISHG